MRLCRIGPEAAPQAAFYDEARVVPVAVAADSFRRVTGRTLDLPAGDDLLPFLPNGPAFGPARELAAWLTDQPELSGSLPAAAADVLVPIPRPNKLFLLAGNYAEHVKERGGTAAERAETFPYVFMKPPSATLTHPNRPVRIPAVSPDAIDWEAELAVVIGATCKGVSEADALNFVAGYTVLNDVTNRRFRPNPTRKKRQRDAFFDWLHGKWFDSFCPCGPCVASADAVPDPQTLAVRLTLNGQVRQDGGTWQMVFPVSAVIAFIASFVTLEPGDIISTGTPAGVGSAKGTYLKPGDEMAATVAGVGTLVTPVVAE